MSNANRNDLLWRGELCLSSDPNTITNSIGYAKFNSRSHDAVIRVYDGAGNALKTREHAGQFKEW